MRTKMMSGIDFGKTTIRLQTVSAIDPNFYDTRVPSAQNKAESGNNLLQYMNQTYDDMIVYRPFSQVR